MTDEQDRTDSDDAELPQGEERPQPRKRMHRRATRPATGGDPAAQVPARAGRDDTDAGWAPDAPDVDAKPRPTRSTGRVESAQDRWWREQRPPHYE